MGLAPFAGMLPTPTEVNAWLAASGQAPVDLADVTTEFTPRGELVVRSSHSRPIFALSWATLLMVASDTERSIMEALNTEAENE
jgi:hypothetical protein